MMQPQSMPQAMPMGGQELDQDQIQLLDKPTWEQVDKVLKDKVHRNFRIGIQTDSTIADSIDSDMAGLKDVLGGITQFIQGVAPAVQAGSMPIEAVKEIVLTIARRSKMGSTVEDALDKIKAPTPQSDPNAGRIQADMQKAQSQAQAQQQQMQMQMQHEQQLEQMRQQAEQQKISIEFQRSQHQAELDAQVEQHKQQAQAQQNQHQNELEAQREAQRMQNDAALEQMRIAADKQLELSRQQFAMLIAEMNNSTKIEVAEIAANTSLQQTQISSANMAVESVENNEGSENENMD